VEEATLCVLS